MKCVRRISVEDDFETDTDPIPEIPLGGVRIRVCYAGATYSDRQIQNSSQKKPRMAGVHDTSLFPGRLPILHYFVSGFEDVISS
jgi:hypothetical protein